MKELFETLRGLCDSVDGVKWVDKDYGQIDRYESRPPVSFPCVLIRMVMPGCDSIGGKRQICTGTVTIRVAQDMAAIETSAKAPQTASDRSLAYNTIVAEIYKKLQGYNTRPINNFDRTYGGDEDRTDGLSVFKMIFSCSFLDESAADD